MTKLQRLHCREIGACQWKTTEKPTTSSVMILERQIPFRDNRTNIAQPSSIYFVSGMRQRIQKQLSLQTPKLPENNESHEE